MKAVLISIQPRWCERILNREKTVEIRKTRPKLKPPFKCYIYCTQGVGKNTLNIPIPFEKIMDDYVQTGSIKSLNCPIGNKKVVGEFVCDRLFPIRVFKNGTIQHWNCNDLEKSCIPYEDLSKYIGSGHTGYAWHISNLKFYDKPKEISEFFKPDKCPYNSGKECTYEYHCYRAGQTKRCGDAITRPPQSWCYVEELNNA